MPYRYLLLLLALLTTPVYSETNDAQWYTPPPEDLVHLNTRFGEVVIMLSSAIAPAHKARFTALVNNGYYNDKYFYRVIDGFVAQAGSNMESQDGPDKSSLGAEFVSPVTRSFLLVEPNAVHAPQTGFINGIPAGRDTKANQQWLLHCPGAVAFARNNDKDSATTEFYIVLGQAPRHLDKNMSVIGKVLSGMEHLQMLPRGEREAGGVLASPGSDSLIVSATTGDSLAASEQRRFRVQQASHPDYQKKVSISRTLVNPFYHDTSLTPRMIDVCYYQTEVEEIAAKHD
ncbi:peptidylprolyl isomerase [Alteromonas halophila]|uniref:peptidylprolyl isomerase n=1 Tax=Alteromonas halophila TaxID=516698 RepID=A0A918JH78_9ALTE|nr:peptidylprolyl isomerase [Alteromonas halophila]GGW75903.1 hypothetical protein GCM10007391_05390 [Alteromonas halophila]